MRTCSDTITVVQINLDPVSFDVAECAERDIESSRRGGAVTDRFTPQGCSARKPSGEAQPTRVRKLEERSEATGLEAGFLREGWKEETFRQRGREVESEKERR